MIMLNPPQRMRKNAIPPANPIPTVNTYFSKNPAGSVGIQPIAVHAPGEPPADSPNRHCSHCERSSPSGTVSQNSLSSTARVGSKGGTGVLVGAGVSKLQNDSHSGKSQFVGAPL